jgi:SAM-dependent methyltransferase
MWRVDRTATCFVIQHPWGRVIRERLASGKLPDKEIVMGSATIQGPLWGAYAEDWAQIQEQTTLPLLGAALDAAHVTTGTRLLDAGCGAGLASLLASLRGAAVSAIDASASQVAIARRRLPNADIREADLEDLPFDDSSFDAVVAINSVFYAASPPAALRELVRVVRPGGRVVVTSWGQAEQCEYADVIRAMGALMPPPPPGAPPGGPFALSEPGVIETMLTTAGLEVAERIETACPFRFPSAVESKRGHVSTGVAQRAIQHSGESPVLAVFDEGDRDHTLQDGSIRYQNVFISVTGIRP